MHVPIPIIIYIDIMTLYNKYIIYWIVRCYTTAMMNSVGPDDGKSKRETTIVIKRGWGYGVEAQEGVHKGCLTVFNTV